MIRHIRGMPKSKFAVGEKVRYSPDVTQDRQSGAGCSRLFARCLTRGQDARTGSGTSLTVTSGSPANINSIRSPDARAPQTPPATL